MNEAHTFIPTPQSIDSDLVPQTIAELRPYVGVADRQDADLPSQINDLFKKISDVTDSLILTAIGQRAAADFTLAASERFNAYARTLRLRSDLLQIILRGDLQASAQLIDRSLNALEFDFKDSGTKQFGSVVTEQAEFTIWTRRKMANLVWKLLEPHVVDHDSSEEALELSKKLYGEFAVAAAWSQFHLECLTTAMRLKTAIYPDVLPAIVEGLRMEVNAYAIAKQMIDLYLPPAAEEKLEPYSWSEEDEELLASSMNDSESEQLEEY